MNTILEIKIMIYRCFLGSTHDSDDKIDTISTNNKYISDEYDTNNPPIIENIPCYIA